LVAAVAVIVAASDLPVRSGRQAGHLREVRSTLGMA
jgi:hypothetical protein